MNATPHPFPALTTEPATDLSAEEALTDLGWEILRHHASPEGASGEREEPRFTVLHPDFGVALLDLAPENTPGAVAAFLKRIGAAGPVPGLPVIYHALTGEDLWRLTSVLDRHFATLPLLPEGAGDWPAVVRAGLAAEKAAPPAAEPVPPAPPPLPAAPARPAAQSAAPQVARPWEEEPAPPARPQPEAARRPVPGPVPSRESRRPVPVPMPSPEPPRLVQPGMRRAVQPPMPVAEAPLPAGPAVPAHIPVGRSTTGRPGAPVVESLPPAGKSGIPPAGPMPVRLPEREIAPPAPPLPAEELALAAAKAIRPEVAQEPAPLRLPPVPPRPPRPTSRLGARRRSRLRLLLFVTGAAALVVAGGVATTFLERMAGIQRAEMPESVQEASIVPVAPAPVPAPAAAEPSAELPPPPPLPAPPQQAAQAQAPAAPQPAAAPRPATPRFQSYRGEPLVPTPGPQGDSPRPVPTGSRRVVVHYPPGLWDGIEVLVDQLGSFGVPVERRVVPATPGRKVIRYFSPADQDDAEQLARSLGRDWMVQDFTTYSPRPRSGTLEVWVPAGAG